ncbi:TonB-dependent receptor [Catenovulum agarivorans]|uniref:TonB-dependent receptor n=1 Tax=Catenovulum agarivorans TaxID=1172192 RepID=UPI0002DE3D05|nr:TonB-dependent receptor [Catenovulum agarivorans]
MKRNKQSLIKLTKCSSIVGLGLSLTAIAQEVIHVTANRGLLASDLSSNNISLIGSQLELNNFQHLNQMLSQVSGTWLSRGNGQESLLAIRSPVFTGAGACNEFLLMQDGVALRAPGFCNVNELFDSSSELAGQIDVVKGAHSAQYGSSAVHGLINIKSPQPTQALDTLDLTLGPDGYIKLKGQHTNTDSSPLYLGLALTHDGGYQHSSGYDQQKLLVKQQSQFADIDVTNQIYLSHLSQQTAGYLQAGENSYKNDSLTRTNAIPDAYRKAISVNAQSKLSQSSRDYSWAVTPYLRWNEMEFLMHYLPGQPDEKNGHHSLGAQAVFQYKLNESIITTGADLDLSRGFVQQQQQNSTNSGSAFLDSILPAGQHYDYRVDASNFAVYIGLEHDLSSVVTLATNLRWDWVKYQYDNLMLSGNSKDDGSNCAGSGCRYTRPDDRNDSFNNLSWNGQLNYRLTQQASTYIKLDHAFRAPHTSELYRLQNGQMQPEIDSQKANSLEIGYHFVSNKSQLKLAMFQMNKSDVIFLDSQRNYVNDAKTRHRGIEVDLSQNLTQFVSIDANLSLAEHVYTNDPDLSNSDINMTGNKMDTAPNLIASTRLNWQLNNQNLLQLEYQHMAEYYLNPENSAKYDGHNLVNLRWQYQMTNNWRLGLQWYNAFNTAYAERADFAFGNYRYFVGQPSRLYLQISYN